LITLFVVVDVDESSRARGGTSFYARDDRWTHALVPHADIEK